MAFLDDALLIGRRPFNEVELITDRCTNVYGESPCTATDAIENLLIRSEQFANAIWVNSGTTIVGNIANSPFASSEADRLVPAAGAAANRQISQLIPGTHTNGKDTFTWSIYVAGDNQFPQLFKVCELLAHDNIQGTVARLRFDLDTKAVRIVPTSNQVNGFGAIPIINVGAQFYYYRLWVSVTRRLY